MLSFFKSFHCSNLSIYTHIDQLFKWITVLYLHLRWSCLYPTVLYPTVFCINCNCPVCNPPPKDTATKDAQDTRITLISVFSWLCYLIFFYFCIFQYSSDAFHQTDLFIGWRYSSNQSGGTRCRTYAKGESFCTFVVIVFLVYLFVYGLFSHQDYV